MGFRLVCRDLCQIGEESERIVLHVFDRFQFDDCAPIFLARELCMTESKGDVKAPVLSEEAQKAREKVQK
jgi:hypothetical protein